MNPDSLQLDFYDKNIKVGKSFPFSGTNTYKANNTHVKNRIISVQLRCERQDKRVEDSLALSILPSDFLMCNEKKSAHWFAENSVEESKEEIVLL